MTEQNFIGTMAFEQQKFLTLLEAERIKMKMPTDLEFGKSSLSYSCWVLMKYEEKTILLDLLFIRALISFTRAKLPECTTF